MQQPRCPTPAQSNFSGLKGPDLSPAWNSHLAQRDPGSLPLPLPLQAVAVSAHTHTKAGSWSGGQSVPTPPTSPSPPAGAGAWHLGRNRLSGNMSSVRCMFLHPLMIHSFGPSVLLQLAEPAPGWLGEGRAWQPLHRPLDLGNHFRGSSGGGSLQCGMHQGQALHCVSLPWTALPQLSQLYLPACPAVLLFSLQTPEPQNPLETALPHTQEPPARGEGLACIVLGTY